MQQVIRRQRWFFSISAGGLPTRHPQSLKPRNRIQR